MDAAPAIDTMQYNGKVALSYLLNDLKVIDGPEQNSTDRLH